MQAILINGFRNEGIYTHLVLVRLFLVVKHGHKLILFAAECVLSLIHIRPWATLLFELWRVIL